MRRFCVMCPNCARINGLEQVGDPLLPRLTPLGAMLPHHTRTDAQNIGAILFSPTAGSYLGGQRVAESASVSAYYAGPFEDSAQRAGYYTHQRALRHAAVPKEPPLT